MKTLKQDVLRVLETAKGRWSTHDANDYLGLPFGLWIHFDTAWRAESDTLRAEVLEVSEMLSALGYTFEVRAAHKRTNDHGRLGWRHSVLVFPLPAVTS